MKKLLLSIRMLLRFKTYTVINLVGLVFSVACALIITRYIHQERTVDHFCPQLDRTFLMTVVNEENQIRLCGSKDRNNDPNYRNPLDDPRVEKVSRFLFFDETHITQNNRQFMVRSIVSDSLFLEILPHPIISGSGVLRTPSDAIITRALSERLFGNEDPLGKTFTSSTGNILTVTGVIDAPQTKSSIQFDLIEPITQNRSWSRIDQELVQLYRTEDIYGLNQKNTTPMRLRCFMEHPMFYQLTPFKGLYFNQNIDLSTGGTCLLRGNEKSLTILTIVAALLLLIGIFNYMNLHTVVMLKRAREFGIKKVYGAGSRQIFMQLYLENFCLGVIALFFIWLFVETTRTAVDHWFNIPVVADLRFDLLISALLLFGMPLITTVFPFLRYNYAPPATSLRSIGTGGHSTVSRKLFLFVQYTITIGLVVTAIYFSRQLYGMLNHDLGYKSKDIIQCSLIHQPSTWDIKSDAEFEAQREKGKQDLALIQRKMNESPLFSHWAYGYPPVSSGDPQTISFNSSVNGKSEEMIIMYVDQKYLELFGFKLTEGRLWKDGKDQFEQYKLIMNEAARKVFGFKNVQSGTLQPKERLWWTYNGGSDNPPYEVVGIVENFKTGHLSRPDAPFAFLYARSEGESILASIVPGKRREAIDFLAKLYQEINGEGEFSYTFVEDIITDIYKEDRRTTRIYITFAIIAICISCLGLFGLSLYDIRQRYREIALRKVNGAAPRDIYKVLLRKYIYILGIAFVAGSTISYVGIEKYMESYSFRVPLSPWIFLTAGGITTIISLCTLWGQIHRAVKIDPAKIMKNE